MQAHQQLSSNLGFEEQYEILLKQLTSFNSALVYGLMPEAPIRKLDTVGLSQHLLGQQFDVLAAYLHAQNILLPQIKASGIKFISEAFILKSLNELHEYIAKTMAQDYVNQDNQNEILNGVYTSQYTMRHKNQTLKALLDSFFDGDISYQKFIKKVANLDNHSKNFISLIQAVVQHNRQQPDYNDSQPVSAKYRLAFDMIIEAYYGGKLDDSQKSTIQECLMMSMPPEKIANAMQNYAHWLINELQLIDVKNLEKVSLLLAGAFQKLVTIHPYFKCNGRLAACWTNLLLVSLDYPSILLEYPGERSDPDSAYSEIIRCIESNPNDLTALSQHINHRLSVSITKPFSDPDLDQLVKLRMQVLMLLKKINKVYSAEEVKNYFIQKMQFILSEWSGPKNTMAQDIYTNTEMIKALTEYLALRENKIKPASIISVGSLYSPKYDLNYKSDLIAVLRQCLPLDQASECKLYDNKQGEGLVCHVKFFDRNNALAVKDQAELLLKINPDLTQWLLLNKNF